MAEPTSFVAARSTIDQNVRLEPEAPESIHLNGRKVVVKFAYKYAELRKDAEWFRMTLKADAGDASQVVEHEHKDRYGRADDQRGYIHVELEVPEGVTSVNYEARLVYGTGAWNAPTPSIEHDETVAGTVRIANA